MENNRLQLLQEKLTILFKTNKWVFVPLVLLLFFLIFLISLLFQPQPEQKAPPTPTPVIPQAPTLTEKEEDEITAWQEEELDDDLTQWRGFQTKETLPDGNIQYFFDSGNPARPNLIITTSTNVALFQRIVATNEEPLAPLSHIVKKYGEPSRIVQGSTFYGPQAVIYIYNDGSAYIVNPQTGEVYEEHLFRPTNPDEYIQVFGNQN